MAGACAGVCRPPRKEGLAIALAVFKTYLAGEVLYASDLNSSFTTIHNNPTSLISPWTANLDADGFDLADLGELEFRDEAADPTADGRLRRSGDELTWRTQDARTNTTTRNWTIWADTTGAPAASIGIGMLFQAESADENPSDFGALDFVASDIGAGTEDTYLSIPLRVAGRALDEKYRFSSTAGEGFAALFTHAVTADRTYTLPDADATLGASGFTRVGGNTTEATTTSVSKVTLITVSGLSIAAGTPILVVFNIRKSTGAAAAVRWGIDLNSTEVITPIDTGATANLALSGTVWVLIGPNVSSYGMARTGLWILGDNGGSGNAGQVTHAQTGTAMPTATITQILITGQTNDAAITLGIDEVHVYTLAVS